MSMTPEECEIIGCELCGVMAMPLDEHGICEGGCTRKDLVARLKHLEEQRVIDQDTIRELSDALEQWEG